MRGEHMKGSPPLLRLAAIVVVGAAAAMAVAFVATPDVPVSAAPPSMSAHASAAPQSVPSTAKAAALQAEMRRLWEDHITWTRLYLVSAIAGLPDTAATADRLLRNQADIGNAVKPYYGAAAGARLTSLLRDHILIAADLVAAAKGGDTDKVAAARTRWYANADEIAGFLGTANPGQWPAAAMRAMMREHLDLTLASATARLKGDWVLDIATYDKIHAQILRMADMLSAGIIAQFPGAFR